MENKLQSPIARDDAAVAPKWSTKDIITNPFILFVLGNYWKKAASIAILNRSANQHGDHVK